MKKLLLMVAIAAGVSACQDPRTDSRLQSLEERVTYLEGLMGVSAQGDSTTEASGLYQDLSQDVSRELKEEKRAVAEETKRREISSKRGSRTSEAAAVSGGRCQAITKKGKQCSRQAQPGRSYCWQH